MAQNTQFSQEAFFLIIRCSKPTIELEKCWRKKHQCAKMSLMYAFVLLYCHEGKRKKNPKNPFIFFVD